MNKNKTEEIKRQLEIWLDNLGETDEPAIVIGNRMFKKAIKAYPAWMVFRAMSEMCADLSDELRKEESAYVEISEQTLMMYIAQSEEMH